MNVQAITEVEVKRSVEKYTELIKLYAEQMDNSVIKSNCVNK